MNPYALDGQNALNRRSAEEIDRINAQFYGRFPYPWRSMRIDRSLDPDFERMMLCQSIGDYNHTAVPRQPRIWVAGCGTNQAFLTALNFPDATVLGSDLSSASLDVCARTAKELSVTNLELRQESINQGSYRDEFDYVLCTGVIHHNSDPASALKSLASALAPDGILELMVYNRFHRTFAGAFQNAIRILAGSALDPGNSAEIRFATSLIDNFPRDCEMKNFLVGFRESPPAHLADALLQPLEYSYTVESLANLAASCGLEILVPCINVFDKLQGVWNWNLGFLSSELQAAYDGLDDLQRWHITNLLLCECSPMLWFYLRRKSPTRARRSETGICAEFLETRFVRSSIRRQSYVLDASGKYQPIPGAAHSSPMPIDPALQDLVRSADGSACIRELLQSSDHSINFHELNKTRLLLTTSAFPFLQAVH